MNIRGFDFKDVLNVNYTSINSCKESGCEDEGICRCTEISNPEVTGIRFSNFVNLVYGFFFDRSKSTQRNNKINEILYGINDQVDKYTIDRIFRVNKIWINKNWDIQIINGYYGQEINAVILKENISEKLQGELETAFSILEINKRVEYLLTLEYGEVLSHLKNLKWQLIRISKTDVIFPSESHKRIVEKKDIDYYFAPNYNLIRAVVIKDGDKWRLIDGYHRLNAISIGDFLVIAGQKN